MGLSIRNVNKSYMGNLVVRDLSMEVEQGSIFGFLGPNGAGKTTTMRMILDLIRPDTGEITWNGQSVQILDRQFWGYLPEERGLYPKMTVEDQLLFLTQLYGIPKRKVLQEIDHWLQYLQISAYRKRQVREMSKGNQQKVQFLATILHDPDVLIMDEPFSGLDPVNIDLLKSAFLELHQRGKTIIFSTHQMQQVEELCQHVMIINQGCSIISGEIQHVKRSTGRKVLRLAQEHDREIYWLDKMSGIQITKRRQDYVEMVLPAHIHPDEILEEALNRGGQITRFELAEPSLHDIFIEKVAGISQPDNLLADVTIGKEG
ncbi:ABC transporter ATP-binding protein [Tengunoibacter tsumagoiensis]|uniref:Putative ABC transporter ATP-binding protein YhaQ n=1 Tax=Tengunoibacter tsumagoiensis TaxID=2014871 RepID=A0A402A6V3_9CHLR|nr:ATP-binding cassette domain-containing protein [Tengunoibacter tsumagoiensis]GCE14862.1 putative ABC transporter ATP-binding protein YhaQ [Tengunoibacter tsumagoiensis]